MDQEVILLSLETSTEAGNFLAAVFPQLDPPVRQRIEERILGLPGSNSIAGTNRTGERASDRLLGCLPPDALVSEAARRRVREMLDNRSIPPNAPPVGVEAGWEEDTEEERWEERGIPYGDLRSARYRSLAEPVEAFRTEFLNSTPDMYAIWNVFPDLVRFAEFTAEAPGNGLHPQLTREGMELVAECCTAMLGNLELPGRPAILEQVRDWLLAAGRDHAPAEDQPEFDRTAAWYKPAPRVAAAEGLPLLCRSPRMATPEALEAVERLSGDAVGAVRYHVAERLWLLRGSDPERAWRVVERMAEHEPSPPVLATLVQNTLWRLLAASGNPPDRVISIIERIAERADRMVRPDDRLDPLPRAYALFLRAYLHYDHEKARELVFAALDQLPARQRVIVHLLGFLRDFLDERDPADSSPAVEAVRSRAWEFMSAACERFRRAWQDLQQAYGGTPAGQIPEAAMAAMREILHLCDAAASNLYFASGAFDEKGSRSDAEPAATGDQKRRFLARARRSIESLASVGEPRVSHPLVQLLHRYIEAEPRAVFELLGRVVEASLRGGYQYESLAAAEVVEIVERYLADYRDLLQTPACQHYLIHMLDAFVDWPAARKLAYRLGDIYR
jgi:hypothetical protein